MSNSVRPHRQQSTRLPWQGTPGKNTGVGCHFPSPMHEGEKWKWSSSVLSDSEWPHGLQPTGLLRPWDFPGKSTGVGCHLFHLALPKLYPLIIFFILRSILSNMRIVTPAFFCFPFVWNIFFHPLTFSLYVSWGLKWVFDRQHIYGSYFCVHSTSPCLLVGAFNPFTFKVIIDMYDTSEKAMAPQSSTLAWKIPWIEDLVGCGPWGHEESDTTERLHFHVSLSCIGEGNGNPLQCSCLENPRDRGAWWAAVYGVA